MHYPLPHSSAPLLMSSACSSTATGLLGLPLFSPVLLLAAALQAAAVRLVAQDTCVNLQPACSAHFSVAPSSTHPTTRWSPAPMGFGLPRHIWHAKVQTLTLYSARHV